MANFCLGIYKGFTELRTLGLTQTVPRLYSVEPAARGPLAAAMKAGSDVGHVGARATKAVSIACTVSSYRGVVALRRSGGRALTVTDDALRAAQADMARSGLYPEFSAAAGLAGLNQMVDGADFDGPVVVLQTAGGVKDPATSAKRVPVIEPTMTALRSALRDAYHLDI